MDAVPLAIKLLQATAMSQAGNERLDLGALGAELDVPELALRQDMDQLIAAGLMSANEDGSDPMLLNAGRQYISRGAAVPRDELWFLPQTIDDLNARRALLLAGRTLVDEFRAEVLNDAGVEYARRLVPSGFATAVDERLALDLYAATVALMARLRTAILLAASPRRSSQ